jgi:hypothetical protein
LANAARNLYIAAALRRVLDVLQSAEVPALLLKGAALVESVYPDPAQREMLDLDILVPGERLSAANAALAPLGYRPQTERFEHHDPPLVGKDRVVAVELHHHIVFTGEGKDFDIGDIWRRARPSANGGHLLPSAEDLLLHVCVHFARYRVGGGGYHRHTGGALGQISDIARIAAAQPLGWDSLIGAARSYRLETRVFLGLFAARELGVPIPERPLTELRPAGFDENLGRRFVLLRVLRTGNHLPPRTMRWMFAPSREVLTRGWDADSTATLSLARAYLRRARANAPRARSALLQPWLFIRDRRLNGEMLALEDRA